MAELAKQISSLLPLLQRAALYVLINKDPDVLMLDVHGEKRRAPLSTFVPDN